MCGFESSRSGILRVSGCARIVRDGVGAVVVSAGVVRILLIRTGGRVGVIAPLSVLVVLICVNFNLLRGTGGCCSRSLILLFTRGVIIVERCFVLIFGRLTRLFFNGLFWKDIDLGNSLLLGI